MEERTLVLQTLRSGSSGAPGPFGHGMKAQSKCRNTDRTPGPSPLRLSPPWSSTQGATWVSFCQFSNTMDKRDSIPCFYVGMAGGAIHYLTTKNRIVVLRLVKCFLFLYKSTSHLYKTGLQWALRSLFCWYPSIFPISSLKCCPSVGSSMSPSVPTYCREDILGA